MMFISKFENFLLEKNETLKYSFYDWDDNILIMPTVVYMDKIQEDGTWLPIDVSTQEFAKYRLDKNNYRYRNNDPKQAFVDFGDTGSRGNKAFLEDVKKSIQDKKFGPSWKSFINCMVNGRLFMIVTSRGHEPKSIRTGVEWIIYNYLNQGQQNEMIQNLISFHDIFETSIDYVIDQYLDNCKFIGVTSKYFHKNYDKNLTVENRKRAVVREFKKVLVGYGKKNDSDISIGYSDDDISFTSNIRRYMRGEKRLDTIANLSNKRNPKVEYYIYDTSDPTNVNKIKI